jgi:hypothetical protein
LKEVLYLFYGKSEKIQEKGYIIPIFMGFSYFIAIFKSIGGIISNILLPYTAG